MDKQAVIRMIAESRVVESLVAALRGQSPYIEDLCQDIYIQLLEKDEDLIVGLYDRNELEYYVRKMISNNVNSVTSPYYRRYESFRKKSSDINIKELSI